MEDWNEDFPLWPALQMGSFVKPFTPAGIDLVEQLVTLNPSRRLSARQCMAHPYFADLAVGMDQN
jgi:serine/threonine protein kinase